MESVALLGRRIGSGLAHMVGFIRATNRGLSSLLLTSLLPLSAFGSSSEHGATELDFSSLLYPCINFSIFVFILGYIYRSKLVSVLSDRSLSLSDWLNRAEKDYRDADRLYSSANRQLGRLDEEKHKILSKLELDAQKMSVDILVRAREIADKITIGTKAQIEREVAQAMYDLKKEQVIKAVEVARLRLGQLGDDVDSRLRESVLSSFEQGVSVNKYLH